MGGGTELGAGGLVPELSWGLSTPTFNSSSSLSTSSNLGSLSTNAMFLHLRAKIRSGRREKGLEQRRAARLELGVGGLRSMATILRHSLTSAKEDDDVNE